MSNVPQHSIYRRQEAGGAFDYISISTPSSACVLKQGGSDSERVYVTPMATTLHQQTVGHACMQALLSISSLSEEGDLGGETEAGLSPPTSPAS